MVALEAGVGAESWMAAASGAEKLAPVSFPCSAVTTDDTVLKLPLCQEVLLSVEVVGMACCGEGRSDSWTTSMGSWRCIGQVLCCQGINNTAPVLKVGGWDGAVVI